MTSNKISENNIRLSRAASIGDAAEVARLIPISSPAPIPNSALCLAARKGHVECVKLLIGVSSHVVLSEHSSPLRKAAENGHTDCVRLLIGVAEESCIYRALCEAVRLKHTECVKLLMNACDVKHRRSLPLQLAAQYNHECIDMLYDISDPVKAVEGLRMRNPSDNSWIVLEQRIEAQRLRGVLSNEVGEGALNRRQKM